MEKVNAVKHSAISEATGKEVIGYVCPFDAKIVKFADPKCSGLDCFILWDGRNWHRVKQETIKPIL